MVESGSFVAAADRLELSTAMVSKHVPLEIRACIDVAIEWGASVPAEALPAR